MLYPLKFKPILKEMIWGGNKIPKILNLPDKQAVKIGENYVVSGLSSDMSIVAEGALANSNIVSLIKTYKGELLGRKVYQEFGDTFPLLIKIIDANDDLSIQVHPDDKLAKENHNSFGKTEMWYVVESEEDSKLISGFSKVTSAKEFELMHRNKQLLQLMEKHSTVEGDVFFIPAGKVHSIGKGNLIAEIQQTSDVTYRIYDFERVDKKGNPRKLHHQLALDAMDYSDNTSGKVDTKLLQNESANLVKCQYFTTNIIQASHKTVKDYSHLDSFVILINVKGECVIEAGSSLTTLKFMEAILIPACIEKININTDSKVKLLEVYI